MALLTKQLQQAARRFLQQLETRRVVRELDLVVHYSLLAVLEI